MPVRDAASYLPACIKSIERQSLADFETIIVDDGSTDNTAALLDEWSRRDKRVKVARTPRRGIVEALNTGLEMCAAPLVARMDGDDVMHADRLRSQCAAFARKPKLCVVASRVRPLATEPLRAGMREYLAWQNQLLSPEAIAADLFWEAPLTHPSAAFRRDDVMAVGAYRDGPFPEDYELWLRLHAAGRQFGKLAATLLAWRVHAQSLSHTDGRYARASFDATRLEYLARYLRHTAPGKDVVVWGAGRRTRRRLGALFTQRINIVACIDIDPRKIG